jgi:phenylacetic acid degradation operon negative regulatory protein
MAGRLTPVHARSALFDLYGDHLRTRDGQAPVAALVRLMAPLGIAPPAVRTAISRMVRQGWLEPLSLPAGRGYRATPRCVQRLDEALARVYRVAVPAWDGEWHLLVLAKVADRGARERLRAGLSYLGYASLGDGTWVAPRPSPGLDELLAGENVRAERFTARYDGDASGLVSRAWDVDALGRSYERWLGAARTIVQRASELVPGPGSDLESFATRSLLVHEWRKFLFTDPGLPAVLLPPSWPGGRAATFFTAEAERLRPAAARYVEACLAG